MVLDLPRAVEAELVREFDLVESFLHEIVLAVLGSGAGKLVFVEDAEFHRRGLAGWHAGPGLADAGRGGMSVRQGLNGSDHFQRAR